MESIKNSKSNTFDISQIPFDDENTWKLIQSGFCKGVFQCESKLVQTWLKRIKPRNVWELSAVIAIVRPGPLKSGFADEYVEYRKGEKEFVTFGHPIIDEVFNITDHVMIYQEQIMSLGSRLAWSHLPIRERQVQVDALRKGVGKKDQTKLVAIGKEFVTGCVHNGLSQDLADKLFDIIKNCGRYVFNLSHSMQYAHVAYKTAYFKCHYPYEFWTVYLTYAKFKKKDKWNEIRELTKEGRIFGINITSPTINAKNEHFCIEEKGTDKSIRFGLSHIKYFGSDTIDLIKGLPEINDWRQVILVCCTDEFGKKLRSQAAEALIVTGAFDGVGVSRQSLLNLVSLMDDNKRISPKERDWIISKLPECADVKNFGQLLIQCADEVSVTRREEIVKSEARMLKIDEYDSPAWIEEQENNYLGTAITATAVDDKISDAIHTVMECHGEIPLYMERKLAVVINKVGLTETKTGKNPGQKMAIISIHDTTGSLDKIPVFPDKFIEYGDLLIEKNTVGMVVKMGKRGWVVESLYQL